MWTSPQTTYTINSNWNYSIIVAALYCVLSWDQIGNNCNMPLHISHDFHWIKLFSKQFKTFQMLNFKPSQIKLISNGFLNSPSAYFIKYQNQRWSIFCSQHKIISSVLNSLRPKNSRFRFTNSLLPDFSFYDFNPTRYLPDFL